MHGRISRRFSIIIRRRRRRRMRASCSSNWIRQRGRLATNEARGTFMPWKWLILEASIVVTAAAAPCLAADAARPGTGQLHLTFTERSPYSHMVEMSRREPFKDFARGAELLEYDLKDESFE